MLKTATYERAEALERYLAPHDDGVFSYPVLVQDDELERFPQAACDVLKTWGLPDYFVPSSLGGALANGEEALSILRCVSRRDLSVAIALGKTYLGAIHVWIAGTPAQQRELADLVRRGEPVSFGLTEKAHGGDVTRTAVRAEPVAGGYLLDGEKWLTNNGTRSAALTVLARTEAVEGARSCSLLLVNKAALAAGSYAHLPKIHTLGIRGADISGIRFERAFVPDAALVGARGGGLDVAIRGLQVTRLFCAGFSLGAADTALRLTLDFVRSRELFGATVWDIDSARAAVVDAFADLLLADATAIVAHRVMHLAPEELSVVSAVVKYLVPTLCERLVRELGVVMGARYYLREEYESGIFQKILRDSAVVSLFDGSTAVNLSTLAVQLRALRQTRLRMTRPAAEELSERAASRYRLGAPLPNFDARRLQLLNFGKDAALQGLELAFERFAAGGLPHVSTDVHACIESLLRRLIRERDVCETAVESTHARLGAAAPASAECFELARRYARLHAAAACFGSWFTSRAQLHPVFMGGEWLAYTLHRALEPLCPEHAFEARPFAAAMAEALLALRREGRLFSLAPLRLAGSFDSVTTTESARGNE